MKATKHILFSLVVALSIITISSCKSVSDKKENASSEESAKIDQEKIKTEIKKVVYELPTPFEFSNLLNEIGAVYNSNVLNNAANSGKYVTERSKALNLGVYAADFGYVFTYDQKVEANQYLKAIKQLLDELNVDIDLQQFADEKQALELNEKDTIANAVTKIFYEVYSKLSENNLPELSMLTATGVWIESVYIATHIAEDTYSSTEIVKLIIEQQSSLNSLINVMQNFKEIELIGGMLEKLNAIKAVYETAGEGLTTEEYNKIIQSILLLRKELI